MNVKHLTLGSIAVAITAAGVIALQPSADSSAAIVPIEEPIAVDARGEQFAAERQAARLEAEASRQEIPAVLAQRAEAARLAEEARKAEEARQAEEARRAEEARNAEEARKAEETRQAEEARQAAPAPAPAPPTQDYGIADSTYTGAYYNPAYESTRKCIVRKESGGNYGIVSANGLYHGAYQFSRSTGDATARMMGRGDLVGTPVSAWSRYDQDTAFWTLWNNGAGRGHWPTARGC